MDKVSAWANRPANYNRPLAPRCLLDEYVALEARAIAEFSEETCALLNL